jgi:hypothetical protein
MAGLLRIKDEISRPMPVTRSLISNEPAQAKPEIEANDHTEKNLMRQQAPTKLATGTLEIPCKYSSRALIVGETGLDSYCFNPSAGF